MNGHNLHGSGVASETLNQSQERSGILYFVLRKIA